MRSTEIKMSDDTSYRVQTFIFANVARSDKCYRRCQRNRRAGLHETFCGVCGIALPPLFRRRIEAESGNYLAAQHCFFLRDSHIT